MFVAVRRAALLCLPFAAIFVAGVTLSPHANAQYPGGGYPGGGGGYPGGYPGGGNGNYPGAGWHPVKPDGTLGNDPLNTPFLFNAYDWTRLDITSSSSYHGYGYGPVTEKYTSGNAQGSVGGVGPYLGDFSDHSIGGTSTIKYQWVPPLNAAGQPDWTNFPAPPLFVLGSINCSGGLSGPADMKGTGHLADGWGWTLSPAMAMPCVVTEPTHRKVLPAPGTPATITLSPSADIHVKVVGPNQTGGGDVILTELAYPITLSAPNPLTNPLLGDGSNQYVYDSSLPDGLLTVPASASALGASSDDTAFLLPHVALYVSPAMNTSAQPFYWAASNATMYVQTSSYEPNGTIWPSENFCYVGLPPNNSYFGNHVMTMKVDGSVSQAANYQLFYTGTATNHPNPDSYNSTNWYYYYSGVYTPFSVANPAYYQQSSSSSDVSFTEGANPFTVHMKDSAYSTSYNTYDLRVFDIDPGFPKYARFIGYLTFPSGIMQFIHEEAHERGHQALFQMGTDGPIYTHSTDYQDPNSSEDGDIVADNWEAAHHLNAGASDTTHAYVGSGPNDAGDGDGELLADVQALAVVFNQFSDWQQDWADGGGQKGAQPFLVPDPTSGVAPGFSLTFTPARASLDGTWTSTGSPQQIKTLGEISTINQNVNGASTGTVVISLTTLGP